MTIYEPTADSPDTAFHDKWVPPGEFCRTETGQYCIQFDEHDWLVERDNWCVKHGEQCKLDVDGRPMKCVKCQIDLPKSQLASQAAKGESS